MPPLTEGVTRFVRVIDAPVPGDAPVGATPATRGTTPSTGYHLGMGYTDQCLELIDTLMVMVQRMEATLVFTEIEVPFSLLAPLYNSTPPAMRGREGRAPA
ncbi:hypothetical protein CsSME_00031275 [Camellia sinensis var. sinensis]